MDRPAQSKPRPKSADANHPQHLTPDEARQGEIILRAKPQRVVFLLGLILPVGVAAALLLWYLLAH